jgi:nicotinamide mononucleotide transporter
MTFTEIGLKFSQELPYIRWQEWLSTVMQIASVWYARQNNILVYPTGIMGVLLASWVYFIVADPPLYADGSLNIYYFFMSVYGWYVWSKKNMDDSKSHPISYCNKRELTVGFFLFLTSWFILYQLLILWTNSDVPMLDALVSSTAVTAMWWMAKRKIENWIAWIISNIIAIPLNFYKGFIIFTIMYFIFLVLAVLGYKKWKETRSAS